MFPINKFLTYISPIHIAYLIILLLFYIIAKQHNYLIYALLLTLPVAYLRYTSPTLGWGKPFLLGGLFCMAWFFSNLLAMLSLAPIGHIGLATSITDITNDLLKKPDITALTIPYSLYKTRLALSAFGIIGLTYAFVQTPAGRGLGLHKLFEPLGGYKLSKKHTQGSSRWSTELELRTFFKPTGPGTIIGKNADDIPYILPYNNPNFEKQRNQNVLIFGTTGSGKSISFVRPNILQADTSFIVTDPKMEIYTDLAPFLEKQGYKVYKFNLVNMEDSDCWNPLIRKNGSYEISIQDAVVMSTSLIANAKGPFEGKGDPFWEDSQKALFTALILYASRHFDPNHPEPDKRYNRTFGDILRFATGRRPDLLDYDFAKLPVNDPARSAFNIFKQASENVRSSIIISLGTSLQLFQDDKLAHITSKSDFDLADAGKEKTAIFVIISDNDTSYNTISALFFMRAFHELYGLATKHNGTCPIFTKFIMDEFCNIGYIPDYTTKLSTMRSRGISAQMIIQSHNQLENRYPQGMAGEIIGNCDIRLLMGANDIDTAEYFSNMIGDTTVEQQTHSRSEREVIDAGSISQRELKRQLITPDEILRMDNEELIMLIRGTYPALLKKMHYAEHPNAPHIPKKGDGTPPNNDQPIISPSTDDDLITRIASGIPDTSDTAATPTNEPYADPTNPDNLPVLSQDDSFRP